MSIKSTYGEGMVWEAGGLGGHFSHLPSPIAINFRARPVGTFETKIAPRGKRSMLTTLEKNSVNHYN